MNEAPRRQSHATAWILGILAALLFYAASWPPVEMKVAGGHPDSFSVGFSGIPRTAPPRLSLCIFAFYRPMHYLECQPWAFGPLSDYWTWWRKVLPK